MKKIKSEKIELDKIRHIENSRLRATDDVGDLMHDIEQRGLLQPIGIRISDNALVYGNRRVKAFEKLGYKKIDADFYDDMTDNELLVSNIVENIKRRNIGSIEIGRMCSILLEKDMTVKEISARIGIKPDRVRSAITSYVVTKDTPFEKMISYKEGSRNKFGNIPETVIWKIQTNLSRSYPKNQIPKKDWEVLLQAASDGNIHGKNIVQLRTILETNKGMDISDAIKILEKGKIVYSILFLDKEELAKELRKNKKESGIELIKEIVKNYNEKLLY